MKERILTGWTFSRAAYFIMGSFIIADSIISKQWVALAFGVYFASMGLFAFGCAAGNCYTGPNRSPSDNSTPANIQFDEIKKSE
jgi:hypothetical protein